MKSVVVLVVGLVTVLAFGLSPARAADSKDLVDTAVSADSFKTLVKALDAAGLIQTLKGPGPFTVFAPTDEAFAKLIRRDARTAAQARAEGPAAAHPHLSRRERQGDGGRCRQDALGQGGERRHHHRDNSAMAKSRWTKRTSSKPTSPPATGSSTLSTRSFFQPASRASRGDDSGHRRDGVYRRPSPPSSGGRRPRRALYRTAAGACSHDDISNRGRPRRLPGAGIAHAGALRDRCRVLPGSLDGDGFAFAEVDRRAAPFRRGRGTRGVRRIVYLGGLASADAPCRSI